MTGFIFSRNLATSAGENSVTDMPFFLMFSSAVFINARDCSRWNLAASSAASSSSFFSAAFRPSHTFLLKITDCGLYWWLVMARCFCTSQNLLALITVKGFSWPSMAFCSKAGYSSGKGSGVGLAPRAETQSTLMGLGMTRSFRPAISSTLVRGRRLLVIWRKPNSQNDRPTMPFSSNLACSLRPTGPSTMVSASLALANKKGKSSTVISLATLAKMPLLSTTISKVPPCTADTLAWSLPSTPPGKRLILILPPDLALTNSAYFSMPITTG